MSRSTPRLEHPPSSLGGGEEFLNNLDQTVAAFDACDACDGVIYVWSPRMPISRTGIAEIERATEELQLTLGVVRIEELQYYAEAAAHEPTPPIVAQALEAGLLGHAPSIAIFRDGKAVGRAVLGYKTAIAYEALIHERLATVPAPRDGQDEPPEPGPGSAPEVGRLVADYEAVGLPGAYFRSVEGRNTLAYESAGRIHLLRLATGRNKPAPGFVDFIPSPDGRLFVTPGPGRSGLQFFDSERVFAAAGDGERPIFTDPEMKDQYPSVGLLWHGPNATHYRVLTSWFTGIRYRDYRVIFHDAGGVLRISPLTDPVEPCPDPSLSIPIISPNGLEVAARDESTGTTKIFRLEPPGECAEVADLGLQTSKVAWHREGGHLGFSLPGATKPDQRGIFIFDREGRSLAKVADSEDTSRLAFPDFVGDSIAFLIPGEEGWEPSIFRVVDGIR